MKKFLSILFSFALCFTTCFSFVGCADDNEEESKPQEHVHTYSERGWNIHTHRLVTNCKEHEVLIFEGNHEYDYSGGIMEVPPTCTKKGKVKYACNICGFDEHYEYFYSKHNFVIKAEPVSHPFIENSNVAVFECDKCHTEYSINIDKKNIIGGCYGNYNDNPYNIILPNKIKTWESGYIEITTIKGGAFSGKNILSVAIPKNIKVIESNAFYECCNLKYIICDTGIQSIWSSAFINCNNFNSVFYIGNKEDWEAKKNVYLPSTVQIYYLSEIKPSKKGNYWHYVVGEPTIWQ